MWRASPSAEAVQRQLLALQDQWQLLKQTAASQSKALGRLRSLQEFNRKAERLEAWIRHKVWSVGSMVWEGRQPGCPLAFSHLPLAQEEKPSLAALLQESPDKIQLTRRILDLKQVRGCQHTGDPEAHEAESRHGSLKGYADASLFLSQEEQQFQSLHKELNSLAQKIEKQGKSESRSISARRKHLNKT